MTWQILAKSFIHAISCAVVVRESEPYVYNVKQRAQELLKELTYHDLTQAVRVANLLHRLLPGAPDKRQEQSWGLVLDLTASMSAAEKVAVVTGGNKGIGLSLVRVLLKLPYPGVVYLTARDGGRGRAAVEQLKSEGLNPAWHQLDISDSKSISNFVEYIRKKHGGLDVLIANGAMPFPKDMSPALIEETLRANNKGNAELCTAALRLLRDNGRLVIVSSGFGQLDNLSPKIRAKFENTDSMTVSQLNGIIDEYVKAVHNGAVEKEGWPEWSNKVSKVGLVALARILSRQVAKERKRAGILVNASCPGWTVTDTSRPYLDKDNKFQGKIQAKEPDEAAVDMVWLATLPPGTAEPNGQLVQYRKILPYNV